MPNGCKCASCYGLREYQQDHGRPASGLPAAAGHTPDPAPLRLVQTSDEHTRLTVSACDGSMTCDCELCQQQRAVLINAGPKRVRQPWEAQAA